MSTNPNNLDPRFLAAVNAIMEIPEEDRDTHPDLHRLISQALTHAPQSLRDAMHWEAIRLGIIPAVPDRYAEDGTPLYSLSKIADNLGISHEAIEQIAGEEGIVGVPIERTHRVQ